MFDSLTSTRQLTEAGSVVLTSSSIILMEEAQPSLLTRGVALVPPRRPGDRPGPAATRNGSENRSLCQPCGTSP